MTKCYLAKVEEQMQIEAALANPLALLKENAALKAKVTEQACDKGLLRIQVAEQAAVIEQIQQILNDWNSYIINEDEVRTLLSRIQPSLEILEARDQRVAEAISKWLVMRGAISTDGEVYKELHCLEWRQYL